MAMYFGDGQCAHCGRMCSSGGNNPYRPGFCSTTCSDAATARDFKSNLELRLSEFNPTAEEYDDLSDAKRIAGTSADPHGIMLSEYALQRARRATEREFARPDAEKKAREDALMFYEIDWNQARQRRLDEIEAKKQEKEKAEADKLERKRQEQLAAEQAEQERMDALIAPRPIPEHIRYEHTHILAPSGGGKTTLIQHLLLEDLQKDNPPGYIIIDPKGLLVERVSRLAVFADRLRGRLVVIDPTHEPAPALNMFRVRQAANLTAAQERRVTNHLTETFSYIFSSAKSPLTSKQSIPFAFLVRLVFFMGGDINTLMDLLEDNAAPRFAEAIAAFSEQDMAAKRFFAHDFAGANFRESRAQIKARVFEIFKNPDLMRIFASEDNVLDIAECMRERKIVLVNTSLAQLGASGSQLLGRYIVAMTLNAAFQRSTIPKHLWHPCHLVIDEFQDYADDEKTPELLRLAREYNLGVTLAHQTMHCAELGEGLRTAVSTNTSIKYCASPEGVDASYMARDLRCNAAFLAGQHRTETIANFACYVRGMRLEHPFVVSCELGRIDREPQISDVQEVEQPVAEQPQQVYYAPPVEAPRRSFFQALKSLVAPRPAPQPLPVVEPEAAPAPEAAPPEPEPQAQAAPTHQTKPAKSKDGDDLTASWS